MLIHLKACKEYTRNSLKNTVPSRSATTTLLIVSLFRSRRLKTTHDTMTASERMESKKNQLVNLFLIKVEYNYYKRIQVIKDSRYKFSLMN